MRCLRLIQAYIPLNWSVNCSLCNSVASGDVIAADRYVISFIASPFGDTQLHNLDTYIYQATCLGYTTYLDCNSDPDPVIDNLKPIVHSGTPNPMEALVVAIVHSSTNTDVATMYSSNYILDSFYPAMEPSPME